MKRKSKKHKCVEIDTPIDYKPESFVKKLQRNIDYLKLAAINFKYRKTKKAYEHLKKSMPDDPYYAWTWHCNIAMPLMDNLKISPKKANQAAEVLMKHMFDVDTTGGYPNK